MNESHRPTRLTVQTGIEGGDEQERSGILRPPHSAFAWRPMAAVLPTGSLAVGECHVRPEALLAHPAILQSGNGPGQSRPGLPDPS